jgi:biopolymer transport protein ExbD
MAMTTNAARDDVVAEVNTTPLIDVMLVLLTLLVITLPIQTHAVKLDMPGGIALPKIIPPSVDLTVDFDGSVLWNGSPVDRATMNAYLAAIARKPAADQDVIHIQANRLAKYDAVARVLADAQRVGAVHVDFSKVDQYH